MYFLVALNTLDQTKILVPLKWIKNVKLPELLNYGRKFHRKVEYLVFYSINASVEPDFELGQSFAFDETKSGCYIGNILRTFSEQ